MIITHPIRYRNPSPDERPRRDHSEHVEVGQRPEGDDEDEHEDDERTHDLGIRVIN